MPKVITICNQKGGVGKTTLTMSLSSYWHKEGRNVVIVDTDRQQSATKWEQRSESFPVPVTPILPDQLNTFAAAVKKRAESADFVLIDTPPTLAGDTVTIASFVADLVLVPIKPDALHIDALEEFRGFLDEANAKRAKLGFDPLNVRLIVNMMPNRKAARLVAEQLEELTGLPVLGSRMGDRADFQLAALKRAGIVDVASPSALSYMEISALANEIERIL